MINKFIHEYNTYVGYEIFPASFKDSNDDGVGDLKGITSKLDYLKDLGIDLIWLCPVFKSPMDDNGYDVSDFFDINPLFGTLDDMKELIKESHQKGLKIILDLVLNHTSDEHEWFKKAISDVNSVEHGYYIFKKGRIGANGEKLPPTNWQGFFNTSAWEYVPQIDEYYMHIFSKKMPDLNYENPILRKKMRDVAEFWLKLGVDGFRLDAIAHLAKDTTFIDSTLPSDKNGLVYDPSKFSNLPKLYDYLKEFNDEVFKKYKALTIGEVGGSPTTDQALKYSNYKTGSMSMVFNFDTCWENGAYGSVDKSDEEIVTNLRNMKAIFLKWYNNNYEYADMPIYWTNHDHPRCLSQYGSTKYRKESGKMLITTLLFMYGLPFILYGDEIGMSNVDYDNISDFKDVEDINFQKACPDIPKDKLLRYFRRCSRTNGRMPFNWSNEKYAGFSKVEPYIKNVNYYPICNEHDESKDPDSILNYYKLALNLRHNKDILSSILNNRFELLEPENDSVFAYTHLGEKNPLIVISNFTSKEINFKKYFKNYEILLHNYPSISENEENYFLRPFETFLLKIR